MNYEATYSHFSWESTFSFFDWNPHEKFNMAHEICDKWQHEPERIAIYWEDEEGQTDVWTYKRLANTSSQMAYYLQSLGIQQGDRVAGLLGKEMELIVTILATWKLGAVYVPLFTAFGPEAICHRLNDAHVKLVVTNRLYHENFQHETYDAGVLEIDGFANGQTLFEHIAQFASHFPTVETTLETPSTIQYTSGSTGLPKGALWPHKILLSEFPLFKYAFGITETDIVYGTGDLGWAHGMLNGTLGPLAFGVKSVVYKGKFDPLKTVELWEKYGVTNVIAAPTVLRMMIPHQQEIAGKQLNVAKISTAGDTLTNEVIDFVDQCLQAKICDVFGATEVGIVTANYHAIDMPIKPGSMGKPMPGYRVRVVNEEGVDVEPNEVGEVVIDTRELSFYCLGYWRNEALFQSKIKDGYYYMGDHACIDEDGYFWYKGRVDDIISSAGYRIGPVEIENCLLRHEAVAEAAAVGKPDPLKGEVVKAYIRLHDETLETEEMKQVLSQYVKQHLSKHQYPKEIEFIHEFPKTSSGKIQRFELKKRASTLQPK